jgi:branched-chain amino acid transport system substrate-binding protein
MKKILALTLALCMVLALCACGSSSTGAATSAAPSDASGSGDVITIGHIGPMTGSLATYGTTTTNAAKLAVKQINDAGGVKVADKSYTLALDAKDDQGDPSEALNAFNELTADGVQLIVGSVTSACTSAITSAANAAGVCLITGCSTADSITTESDYVFRSCFKDSFAGSVAAYYALKNNIKSVGVIYCAADTYSKGLYDAFSAACKEHGITVAAEASTDTMDAVDFTNQVQAMVSAGVKFIFCPYYYNAVGPYLVPQARAAGYDGVIFGADGFDGTCDVVSKGTESAFHDVLFCTHYSNDTDSQKVKDFVSAYKTAYGDAPNALAALVYDAVYMYKQAIEGANSFAAKDVQAYLADTSHTYECVTGTFTLDEAGTPVKGCVIIGISNKDGKVSQSLSQTIDKLDW